MAEYKYDGQRALIHCDARGEVRLLLLANTTACEPLLLLH